MAIIKCPECGHDVSDKAPFCPSCGLPIAKRVSNNISNKEESISPKSLFSESTIQEAVSSLSESNQSTYEYDIEKKYLLLRNNRIVIVVVVLVALLVSGICWYFYRISQSDRESQAYEYAMSSKDLQVLEDYLAQYSNAPEEHRDSVQAHIKRLNEINKDWTNVLVSASKSEFEKYISQYPDSPFKAIAVHKIDSIDWLLAERQGTVEALETYLEQHSNGEHVDDANNYIKSLNSNLVTLEEKHFVSGLFNSFFQSLNNHDEDALASIVSPLLTNFLGKTNATRSDVVTFMNKIYKSDVSSMLWQSLDDYVISKIEVGNNVFTYNIAFSAIQNIVSTNGETCVVKFKINAKVNEEARISEFTMVKILE